jgi:lysophospholipase L1-like esterase
VSTLPREFPQSYVSSSTDIQEAQTVQATPFTVVAFGDSTTAPWDNVVTYSDLLQQYFDQKKLHVRVLNAGVRGHTTAHAVKRFEDDVLAHHPRVVIIQFGINDAAIDVWRKPPARVTRVTLLRYGQNLRKFVRRLNSTADAIFLMTPNPLYWTEEMVRRYGRSPYDPKSEDGFNVILKDYASAVRRIAGDEEVGLIDVYAAFQDFGLTPEQSMADLLLDGMHPNSLGHSLVAQLLIERLEQCNCFS